MAYDYERLIGCIGDLVSGDGGRAMAQHLDCPVCGRPLDLTVVDDDELTLVCPSDPRHLSWHGYYEALPAWIDEYKRLNR